MVILHDRPVRTQLFGHGFGIMESMACPHLLVECQGSHAQSNGDQNTSAPQRDSPCDMKMWHHFRQGFEEVGRHDPMKS